MVFFFFFGLENLIEYFKWAGLHMEICANQAFLQFYSIFLDVLFNV